MRPSFLASAALVLIAGCLWFFACSASSPKTAPQVTSVVGTVAPTPEAGDGALSVVFAGPRGAAALGSSINVLFSKPMRSLESAAAAAPQLELTPAVAGEWQWVGARALTFFHKARRLPAATAFQVRIPPGLRALDGEALAEPYEFRFETPAVAVLRSEPENDATGLPPNTRITLAFNQAVAPSALASALTLIATTTKGQERWPLRVRQKPKAAENVLEVIPERPLPLAAKVSLRVAEGLRGKEGSRGLEHDHALAFATYGPLRVVGVNCHILEPTRQCNPEGSVWIEFSNPVRLSEVAKHLSLDPPAALSWSDEYDEETSYVYLPLSGGLAAATSYRARISAGLTDSHGQRLAASEERQLITGNYVPWMRLPISGEVFPAPLDEIALGIRNASDVRVYTKRLEREQLLDYHRIWDDYEKRRSLPEQLGAKLLRLPSAVDNQLHTHAMALGPILGPAARGAAWLGFRHADASDGQLVQVTDLALTAKLSTQGSLVWVTRLSDGTPVPGATVELLGRSPAIDRRYRADGAGLVQIPPSDYRPRFDNYSSEDDTLIVVRHGQDWSYRRVADFSKPWLIDAPMRLGSPEREYALLFSERGIYRPGDAIQVKGILRRETAGGNALVAGRKLLVRLLDPFGEKAAEQSVESTRFGTFATELRVPGSGALGNWRIEAEGFAEDPLGVQVAEYRAVEFKVNVAAERASYLPGDKAQFAVGAEYLFGSPMAGAQVTYAATRERRSFTPPNSEGYATSEDVYRAALENAPLASASLARGEAKLSAAGRLELGVPLALPGQIGPEQVRVDAEVSDLSRQAVAANTAVIVHPAAHYVGIGALDSWFQNAPGTISPRVVALTPEGKRVPGRKVKLELVRRRWAVARERTSDGWRTLTTPVDEPQGSCEVVTRSEPVSCELSVREPGQSFVIASSKDAAGRLARSALTFYAIGEGRVSWADNDQRKLELVLDKPQYRVGDTARLLVKSPFEKAEALLTVERAGVLEHRRLTLSGPTPTVEIKVDERARPNVFVAVHLLQGVAANQAPMRPEVTPEPGYRMGIIQLQVDPAARRLGVELSGLARDYRPGQQVRAQVQVTGADGKPAPAELTVYAVDEGVLSLIGYTAPDPLQRFTAPRPLAVATLETREVLGRRVLLGPETDKGVDGGGGEGGGALRSDFRTTAHFNPELVTDAQGRANVEFTLPDNLTTFRLMAVAVSEDDRYGSGSAALVVNQPLMVRPALPRSLRAGDRFEASAIISSRQFEPGAVKVRAEVTGATLHGAAERDVTLGRDASVEVRFDVEAAAPGEARFSFSARAAGEQDEVTLLRRVESPKALETTAVYGRTDQTEALALGELSGLREDVGGLNVSLAATALIGLDAGLKQLQSYPYECTEQLASRTLPLGPLAALAERYGFSTPPGAAGKLERQVGEILRRQHGDGGFGFWPDSPRSHAWLSGYVLWVLWQAKSAGALVPERVFEQGMAYLRRHLGEADSGPEALATRALFVDVLAALGKPDREFENRLFEQRQNLPVFARALLLHAAATGVNGSGNAGVLARELESLVTLRGNKAAINAEALAPELAELFDSEARTEAIVLWALLAESPVHPFAAPLAQGLLDRRSGGTWQSTQETAYALLALDAYRRAQEPEPPHFEASVWLGELRLAGGSFNGPAAPLLTHHVPMLELGRGSPRLAFEKRGDGKLFYEARLTYAGRQLPSDALERGFALSKSMRVVRPEDLERALSDNPDGAAVPPSLRGGDLVLVDLTIAAPAPRHFVVIEDPLAAGLEAVDSRLMTTSQALDVGASPGVTDGFRDSWFRQEVRDDRVLFFVDDMPEGLYRYRYLARATALGRFVVPPTRVEEMYQPEVFGRSGASYLEVR